MIFRTDDKGHVRHFQAADACIVLKGRRGPVRVRPRPAGNGVFGVTNKSAAERLEASLLGNIQIERTCPLYLYFSQKYGSESRRRTSDGRS